VTDARWVIGSGNAHKVAEIGAILAPWGIGLVTPRELGIELDVAEDGSTFASNAARKALAWAAATGRVAVADDSGLAVDALGGAPGVHSARWAEAPSGVDAANNARLVRELASLGVDGSAARYHCTIAIAGVALADARAVDVDDVGPDGAWRVGGVELLTRSGVMEGRVVRDARGAGGFGYDPHFVLADGRHLAEVGAGEKNAMSHRAMALREVAEWLRATAGG
jgi:XTP/dITP diphosphohydrolase